MRRHLLTLALLGLFGALASTDAQACHKKKCAQPAPCVVVEPCPPPAPVCEPVARKKCCFGGIKLFKGGLCHKKKVACEPAPVVCEAPAPAPVYAAPQASPQASGQGM